MRCLIYTYMHESINLHKGVCRYERVYKTGAGDYGGHH